MGNTDRTQNSIILGALLHDLEKKFAGENFLNNCDFFNVADNIRDMDVEVLKNCLFCNQKSPYFKIISLANKFQSGKEILDEKISLEEKLVNLFPNISIKEDKTRQDKEKISFQKLVYSNLGRIISGEGKSGEYRENFKKEFNEIISRLEKEKNILSFETILSFFILVLKKYLWCLPANTEDKVLDVSLWEHLALTAAISNCLYLYLKEKNLLSEEKIKELKNAAENKEVFRLIIGDFSGIQKYIFDIAKMKKAAQRLKGRSFLVQMISEDIKNYIIEELRLCSLNTIICAGGKFVILVPNRDSIEKEFEEIKEEVEDKIFKKFEGEIRFNLALSKPFKGEEFGEIKPNVGNFGKYFDDAFIKLAKEKYNPFGEILKEDKRWNEDAFILDKGKERSELTLCRACKKYLIKEKDEERYRKEAKDLEEDYVCQNCGEEVRLGKRLRKEKNKFVIWKERDNPLTRGEIELLFNKIELVSDFKKYKNNIITIINPNEIEDKDEAERENKIKINDIKEIIQNHQAKVEARFFATYVSTDKEEEIKDFGKILEDEIEKRKGKGVRKLAILKGDVDNLGKIFYFGLKNYREPEENAYTAARLKTLSLFMNLFFEGYIDYLARDNPDFKNLYIVFSGGDDFTIVGYWETLIDFALKLREDFEKFACGNKEVHFSATIHLMDHKWAVYDEITKAEEELETAKEFDEKQGKSENKKNKVYIFGKVLKWEELKEIKELANSFQKFIDEGVSMGYLWKLHKIAKMIYNYLEKDKLLTEKKDKLSEKEKNNLLKEKAYLAMWRPYFYYFTERDLKKNPKAKEWVEKNLLNKRINENIIKNLDIFTTYLLYKNRR